MGARRRNESAHRDGGRLVVTIVKFAVGADRIRQRPAPRFIRALTGAQALETLGEDRG